MYRDIQEQKILDIANTMIAYDWRLLDLESNFGYPCTSIHRWLTRDLKFIDDDVYIQCKNIMKRHKHEHIPRGRRY